MLWSDFFRQKISGSVPDDSDNDHDSSQNTAQSQPCADDGDPQISNEERHVQEYRKSHQQCKNLQRRLEESTKQREHLERQLDSHKIRENGLQRTLDSCRDEMRISRMGQLCAEEKFRRQTQILEECRAELDASLGENKSLVIKQAALQKWTDRLDDDEARQTMAQLYQCLEGWVRRYFPGLSSANKTSNVNPDSLLVDESNRLDIFYGIYDLISNAVFRTYLTRIMVGINDSDFSNKVSMLDRHIRAQCPAHVAQHWRSAMNEATYSLSGESRYSDCKRLAASLDSSYDFYTSMAPDRRIQDLALLLGRFVGLKFRLDSQADLYTFTWKESGTPFNEEEMTCFDGQCAENGVVQYCLSPALYKESKGCGPLLIKKAAVILSLDLQHSSAGEYDSDGAVSAHDVKMGDI